MHFPQLVLSCLLLVAIGAADASESPCPVAESPPAPVCVSTAHGLAYAETAEEAADAARALAGAAQAFAGRFGEAPSGVLVLSASADAVAVRAYAKAHGLDYGLVWLPARDTRAMTGRALRQSGLERSRITQAVAKSTLNQTNVLRHEVGHAMFEARYWPQDTGIPGARYASPGPDWLDEAAAILMESADAQGTQLATYMAKIRGAPRRNVPLAEFLKLEHPTRSAALTRALARSPKSDSGVQMTILPGSDDLGLATFYGQSLLLALFLCETSGDARVLAPISTAVAEGSTLAQWLSRDGARHGLPGSLPALQSSWDAWVGELTRKGRGRGK